jgi:hypothetical protein
MMSFSEKEKYLLRDLAIKLAELASGDSENEKKSLWYKHNALERTRPLIMCDPEGGWNEIITNLECENETARMWEWFLRREIFWGSAINDDRVIEPYFNIHYTFTESDWGVHETYTGGEKGGSYSWDAPLKNLDDLSGLHFPRLSIDREMTEMHLDMAKEIFRDILTVRLRSVWWGWWWSLGLTQTLIKLRGLEQIMYDMVDNPKGVHNLMAFIRDGHLAKIEFLEKNNYLMLNNEGDYVGSGGFGWTNDLPQKDFNGDRVRAKDMWCLFESQETSHISPEMFEEFVFQYQLPVMEKFGLICYGCCEPLDKRWHIVKKTPNLRRISVSPWANMSDMAEMLSDKYIYSWKPNPAYLASTVFDEPTIRKYVQDGLEKTRGCNLEIIMKDNHTIGNDPNRVVRWVQIVREEIDRIY